jgi:dihydrofolate synthase/folylpolyglutamate synthase
VKAYQDAIGWLYGLEAAKGMDFKLERVELALASLGDPHRAYPCVHVAGTNGKGSVAAMCHAILTAGGYRPGLYVSPHLVRFTERVRVADVEIRPDEVADLVAEIRRTATSRGIDLTFFEFTTVLAFLYFARCDADAAVVEVGLGGRLDATNVVAPEVAVVTSIGLDHQEWLGSTIEEIAREKGGILKPGRPVVIGRVPGAAEHVLRGLAAERGCRVYQLGRDFSLSNGVPPEYRGLHAELSAIPIPLRGAHQRDNTAVAVAALEAAGPRLAVTARAIRDGLARTRWPGRLEIIDGAPTVILDGAHNPDGVEALVREMRTLTSGRKVHLLFAVMRDKDWRTMARSLAEIADQVTVSAVLPPRGEPPENVARVFAETRPTRTLQDPVRAFEQLLTEVRHDEVVLVAGSLFLVGAVYPAVERLRGRRFAEDAVEAG